MSNIHLCDRCFGPRSKGVEEGTGCGQGPEDSHGFPMKVSVGHIYIGSFTQYNRMIALPGVFILRHGSNRARKFRADEVDF